jgi:DNA-binding MarR family transcriptional regulator
MTRLDLVKTFTHVLHRRALPPSHALAIILIGGNPAAGITRSEFLRASGLSETAVRRVLDSLVRQDIAIRIAGTATPPSPNPPYIYHLTEAGEALARELLAQEKAS